MTNKDETQRILNVWYQTGQVNRRARYVKIINASYSLMMKKRWGVGITTYPMAVAPHDATL